MIGLRRIICPTDFSDNARLALDQAIMLARWSGASITVMHVAESLPPLPVETHAALPGLGPLAADLRANLEKELGQFAARATQRGVRVETMLSHGDPADEILRGVEEHGADLLVMGTHGRSGFRRFMLGSVTEKVLHLSHCPVLTLSGEAVVTTAPEGPPFSRILCAIDFSDASTAAMRTSLELAGKIGARLALVHVVELLPDWEIRERTHFDIPEFGRYLENDAREMLRDLVPAEVREKAGVELMVVRGRPHREVLRIATEMKTDLIVMGVQGRGAMDLMIFGSTTRHVVREARCPVLTISDLGTAAAREKEGRGDHGQDLP